MAHNTKNMLTDASGKTQIPQYFDQVADSYKPLTNQGMYSIRDSFENVTSITKTYTSPMRGFSIQNDSTDIITFTINGLTIKLKPTEGFEDYFEPFTSVQITANGAFRAMVRG
jgi:hypothetical protein